MFFRWHVIIFGCLPIMFGCGAWPFSSLPPTPAGATSVSNETTATESTSTVDVKISRPRDLPFLSGEQTTVVKYALPRLGADQSYGVWLSEDGPRITWIRLEKPLFHVVTLDREKDVGWVMDGVYSFARDKTVFGVIKAISQLDEAALAGLSWSEEQSLRGIPVDTVLLPFSCRFCEPIKMSSPYPFIVAGFRGPVFHDERDRWTSCRFDQVALARPGQTHAYPPLGNWERRSSDSRDRVVVNFLPDQIGVTVVEGSGKRTRLKGECVAATDGIVYGIFTTADRSFGNEKPEPLVPAAPFCLRMGYFANRLEIREVQAVGLDENIRAALQGEYLPGGKQ